MSYVRNTWYVAAWSAELQASQPVGMKILGDRIVIYRTESGRLTVLEDRCVHRLAPLSLGRCEGERLRCMYHGILFNPDGAVAEIPGQEIIPPNARVRSYPVAEKYGWIWVWMGDPAKVDESLIPTLVGLNHPDYILGHDNLDYDASAHLISENLLDFSHTAYVHADSFKLPDVMAKTHADISPINGGIRYLRWIENWSYNAAGEEDTPCDSYMAYDYLVPGILRMDFGSFSPGTAKRLNFAAPDMKEVVRDHLFSAHAVTPLDERKTRYFFMYGTHRRVGNEASVPPLMRSAHQAFAEDKVMIEAQQRVIDETPVPVMLPTSHDKAITLYNGIVKKLIRAEVDRHPAAAA